MGNIPFDVAEEYIKELLCKVGQVIPMSLMTDKYSFQSKCFGFVEMATVAEANIAMEALDGKMLLDRTSIVLKRNNRMIKRKLCSFCISKETCKKPEAERENNCEDYMLRTNSEKENNE